MVNKIVPKIRFKEFNSEYYNYKLKDIVEFYRGNTLSKADLIQNGIKKCILYGELYTKYSEIAYEIFSRTNNSNKNLFLGKTNDVLIPCSGETALDISTSTCLQEDNVVIGGDLNVLRPKKDDGKYLSYLLCHKKRREIAKFAQGDSIVHLYGEKIKNINIHLPNIKEQMKVSHLLSLLDKKIELENRRIENLKLYKLYIMKSIFKEKNNWNKYRLFEICQFYSGGTPTSSNKNFYNGNIPFIRSGEIHQTTTELYINEEALKYSSAKLVKKGDILYALYGATSGEVSISQIDGAINQAILCIKSLNEKISNYYIKEYLKYEKDNIINKYLQGGQGNLSANIIKNIDIYIPNLKKQEKICKTFNLLDEKIRTNVNKIEELKNIKLYLLKNMFV